MTICSCSATARTEEEFDVAVAAGDRRGEHLDVGASELRREGDHLVTIHRFPSVRNSFYLRVRGTNTEVDAPKIDSTTVNPWDDLWFYSNPVFVRVPGG